MRIARVLVAQWRAARPLADVKALNAGRLHILDALGVGLAASTLDQGETYRRFAEQLPTGPAILLANGKMASASDAALVNGGLIHSLEFDDTHTASIVHGSAVLLPAALAAAQASGASSEAMLASYIKGWDAMIRIGLAAQGGFQRRGFQITSVAGSMIAAMIAADLMDATDDQAVAAMGIALSQASGVFEFLSNGSSVKSMHPGWAAHAGLIAAQLAVAGMGGPETAFEGSRGLFAAFTAEGVGAERFARELADFGSVWHVNDAAFKFVPSCHYLHPFVEGARLLVEQGVGAAAIDSVAEGAAPIVCDPWDIKLNPRDGHAARWSLPIVVAEQFVHGRVDLETFTRRADDRVRALAARMTWEKLEPHRFPHAFEAKILVKLTDGSSRSIRLDDVFGNASRPAGDEAVLQKFRANVKRALRPGSADDLITWGYSIERGATLDELNKILSRRMP
jgi:2-methylcitrate dehydratase PrpD